MAIVAAVLLVLTVLAACTGGGDGDQAGDTAGSAPPAGTTATSPGPAPAADCALKAGGQQTLTLDVDGRERSYVVVVPDSYGSGRPLPMVMVVHGLGGTAEQILAYSRWPEFGRRDGFVVVAPQSASAQRSWDFATAPDQPGSDSRFLVRLAEHADQDPCLAPDRQYLTGLSNGAAMTFAMACFAAHDFAAYGAVAGAGYQADRCDDAPPASFVYFHGTADRIVPIAGGKTPLAPVQPLARTLDAWAAHDGCAARPTVTETAPDVELSRWRSCDAGARIDAYVVDGGGHTWPGSTRVPMLGATTSQIDATEIMADFFGLNGS